MNAHMEIQELLSKSSNKLESNSVNQVLDILLCIKSYGCQNCWDIATAYREGVAKMAVSYFVARATIRGIFALAAFMSIQKYISVSQMNGFSETATLCSSC